MKAALGIIAARLGSASGILLIGYSLFEVCGNLDRLFSIDLTGLLHGSGIVPLFIVGTSMLGPARLMFCLHPRAGTTTHSTGAAFGALAT